MVLQTDEQNPFYCPTMPAVLFLENVRQKIRRPTQEAGHDEDTPSLTDSSIDENCPSFAQLLDQSLCEDDLKELLYQASHESSHEDHSFSFSSVCPGGPSEYLGFASSGSDQGCKSSPAASLSFSDFALPAKRERSVIEVNDGSFELSSKADKIRFFSRVMLDSSGSSVGTKNLRQNRTKSVEKLSRRLHALEDELYGQPIGTESPRGILSFISRLDAMLPGTRFKEKMLAAGVNSHQQIVDILASDGYLNARMLDILRTSEIEFLDLSTSISDEDGLNLDSRDSFRVFSKPNSFLFLFELNLAGSDLYEADLVYLHNLPRLARLWLARTGVGNESMFYITPLKRTLTDLDIADNPKINDDAISAILVLYKLQCFCFSGTGITMNGVRRLAKALTDQDRVIEVEVPSHCMEYVNSIPDKYLLRPAPPLIVEPDAVASLETHALRHNLACHLRSDENERNYLIEHLQTLLQTRKDDLLARALVLDV